VTNKHWQDQIFYKVKSQSNKLKHAFRISIRHIDIATAS